MAARLGATGLLTLLLAATPAAADECKNMWQDGRAIHADLQRKAIEELNWKDYPAACASMRELSRLANAMRDFVRANCWANASAKRRVAAADNIAARTEEICAQAGR